MIKSDASQLTRSPRHCTERPAFWAASGTWKPVVLMRPRCKAVVTPRAKQARLASKTVRRSAPVVALWLAASAALFAVDSRRRPAAPKQSAGDTSSSAPRNDAQYLSKLMLQRSFFNHVNPDGLSPVERLSNAGIPWSSLGENIARNHDNLSETEAAFMRSSHRHNILNPAFTHVGVGIVRLTNGALYVTQVFAQEP